jgi:hypothetical protein
MISSELIAVADLCIAKAGTANFGEEDRTMTEERMKGNIHARARARKLEWVEKRMEYHCQNWKAFETAFIKHHADAAFEDKQHVHGRHPDGWSR